MFSQRRGLILAAVAGTVLLALGVAADLLDYRFWDRHALLASLVSSMLVLVVTLAVVNEVLERRDRKRWSLLAQTVLFALTQAARSTWTSLVEVLRLAEVETGTVDALDAAAEAACDAPRVLAAARETLADPERREILRQACAGLRDHFTRVIADWAGVMVGARPYAEVLDRHVELAARLEWLVSILNQTSPPEGQPVRDRVLARSSLASEHIDEHGTDAALSSQIAAVTALAVELDRSSRDYALSIVSMSWWTERTYGLAGEADFLGPRPTRRSAAGARRM